MRLYGVNWGRRVSKESVRKFNEEHPSPDASIASLLKVPEGDGTLVDVSIPYGEFSDERQITVDALVMIAGGLNARDTAKILSSRYEVDYKTASVTSAVRNHPDELEFLRKWYSDLYKNQQLKAGEQMLTQRLSEFIANNPCETWADAQKAMSILRGMAEVRATKEANPDKPGIDADKLRQLENNIKILIDGDRPNILDA